MSELCLSSNPKTTQFSSLLLSDLFLFFSFILSHPLYFSYFIFFSPYLLKLLSFLSPLFITTSLLLLGFLTLSPGLVHENSHELSESRMGFLLSTYHVVTERLRSSKTGNEDEEFHRFEELEAYKMVFDTSTFYARENSDEVLKLKYEENCFQAPEPPLLMYSSYECSGWSTFESLFANLEEKTVETTWQKITQPIKEAKRLEGLLIKELDEFENMIYNVEEKKVELPSINSEKVEVKKEVSLVGSGSKCRESPNSDHGGDYTSKFFESPSSRTLDSNLGTYGSMRKEKEWKKTLACKLFEERHNVDGGEGMDLLWETYETDPSNKAKPKIITKKKNKKKGESEYYEANNDDDDEEEDMDGQLCCLQALKFSAGKMNLGMRRPNLVKFSKAIKGIGWLHRVTRHGRKA